MNNTITVYTIRIIYKSGFAQDFEATEFSVSSGGWYWKEYGPTGPLSIGVDDIAAVWTMGRREVDV